MFYYKLIEVFDKNYNLLAVFDKNDIADEDYMIDPTVSITQNGESTFSFSIDVNSQKWKEIKGFENIYRVNEKEYTALNDSAYTITRNQDGSVIVSVKLVETWYLLGKRYEQIYNANPEREGVDEHTIIILPKNPLEGDEFEKNTIYINGEKHKDSECLYPRGSAGYCLWALLYDTDWSLDICDVIIDGFDAENDYGCFNIETDQKTILENIQAVQELYGGILVWDSVHKTLSLRDDEKWQPYHGFLVKPDKNLLSIENVINNEIITRLYPMGENNLNIAAVNNNKTYLENFSHTNRLYEKILQNANIYSQKALKLWGERKLKELSRPSKSITANIVDLRTTEGYEHETFELNHIVDIIDPIVTEGEIERQRIISWTYNVFAMENATIELGSRTKNVVEIIRQSDDNNSMLDSIINNKSELTTAKIKSLADFKKEANEKYATIELLALYQKEIDDQFTQAYAQIKLLADADKATLDLITAYKKEVADQFTQTEASIKMVSDANQATVKLLTDYKKEVANQFTQTQASITAVSNENSATLKLLTQYQNSTTNKFTAIEQSVDKNEAKISLVVSGTGSSAKPNAASIVASINSAGSTVKINADRVEIDNLFPYRIRSINNADDYLTLSSNGADVRWYRNGREFFTIYDNVSGYQFECYGDPWVNINQANETVTFLWEVRGVEARFG
ncbi:MAG: hypothetical protein HFE57_08420 [Firmicutes bacterium]|jgi:hypothetical protein|nr:hypothetical protein [Bacillota bacterium]